MIIGEHSQQNGVIQSPTSCDPPVTAGEEQGSETPVDQQNTQENARLKRRCD